MITNKERLEKIIEQLNQLERLAEGNRDRVVYPVSFFSQAYDIANKILDDLQQIELNQIRLIESQVNEHILPPVFQSANSLIAEDPIPVSPEPPVLPVQNDAPVCANKPDTSMIPGTIQPPQLFSQEEIVAQTKAASPANNVQEMVTPPVVPPPVHPVQEEKKAIPTDLFEQKQWIDLKKMITLNDRFLFCRELFANNENLMNQVLSELSREKSYDASIDYLQKRFNWDFEDKNVTDFIAILKKRFS